MATKSNAKSLVSNLGIRKIKSNPEKGNEDEIEEKRPSTETGCKEGDARTTIILNKELIRKVKFIALADGTSIKDKVTEALTQIIKQWEDKNGKIPLK